MSTPQGVVARAAVELASVLPRPVLHSVADAISGCDPADWGAARSAILRGVPNAPHRRLVADFLDRWHSTADPPSPAVVAASLVTAAESEAAHRRSESTELVWTGPAVAPVPMRRTERAILEVIGSAERRILIVSYAVYHISHIRDALIQAAERGVEITLVLESPDRLDGENTYDTLRAFGDAVAERCSVFIWPSEHRESDQNGKTGILHVKAVVADGRRLFVSSANLTEYAFTVNMELGVLMKGERLAHDVERHFGWLIENGILEKIGGD